MRLLAGLQLTAEAIPHGIRIAALDGHQLQAISDFIARQNELPSLLRFGRPSLEQLYLRLNGGRL